MTASILRRAPLLGVAGLVVLVDQATKLLAASQLADGRIVQLLPGLINGQLFITPVQPSVCSEGRSNGWDC